MDKIVMRGKKYKITSNENQYDLEVNENTLLLKRGVMKKRILKKRESMKQKKLRKKNIHKFLVHDLKPKDFANIFIFRRNRFHAKKCFIIFLLTFGINFLISKDNKVIIDLDRTFDRK